MISRLNKLQNWTVEKVSVCWQTPQAFWGQYSPLKICTNQISGKVSLSPWWEGPYTDDDTNASQGWREAWVDTCNLMQACTRAWVDLMMGYFKFALDPIHPLSGRTPVLLIGPPCGVPNLLPSNDPFPIMSSSNYDGLQKGQRDPGWDQRYD